MTALKITIGKFDAATRTVPVAFEHGELRHERVVNAVIGADGKHDRKATVLRVDEVGQGVAHKFGLGLLGAVETEEPEQEA